MNPDDVNVLARYNAEVARGLVHTEEWHQKMKELKEQFNAEFNSKVNEGWMKC